MDDRLLWGRQNDANIWVPNPYEIPTMSTNGLNETVNHVIQCQSYGTHCLWQKLMRTLSKWITENDGPEGMGDVITQNLTAWWQNSMFLPLPNDAALRKAILHQDSLGWRSFLNGFISTKWRQTIEMRFKETNSKKSRTLWWVSRFVRKIWDLQRQLWNNRNEALVHGEGNTIHVEEITAINAEVISQWTEGSSHLPMRYHHLFKGKFRLLYQSDYHRKQQWLTSVWLVCKRKALSTPSCMKHHCWELLQTMALTHQFTFRKSSSPVQLLSWAGASSSRTTRLSPILSLVKYLSRTAVGRFKLQHNGDSKAYMALVV